MLLRTEGVFAAAGEAAIPALVPPVTANLEGLWQIDGTGRLQSTSYSYTGRLNNAAAISAIFAGETPYLYQWDDMSGSGNHASANVASRPQWIASGGLSSGPCIYNPIGGAHGFDIPGIEPGTQGTYYCAVKAIQVNYLASIGSAQYDGSGAAIKFRNNGDIWFLVQQGSGLYSLYNVTPNAYAVDSVLRIGIAWNSTNLWGNINGTEYTMTHSRDTSAGTSKLRIIADAEPWYGYSTAFSAYSVAHDSNDRAAVISWLSNYV